MDVDVMGSGGQGAKLVLCGVSVGAGVASPITSGLEIERGRVGDPRRDHEQRRAVEVGQPALEHASGVLRGFFARGERSAQYSAGGFPSPGVGRPADLDVAAEVRLESELRHHPVAAVLVEEEKLPPMLPGEGEWRTVVRVPAKLALGRTGRQGVP
jgi:hypothetical protein